LHSHVHGFLTVVVLPILPLRIQEFEVELELDSAPPELIVLVDDSVKVSASRSESVDRRQRQKVEDVVKQFEGEVE
jgi:hypothetical protein